MRATFSLLRATGAALLLTACAGVDGAPTKDEVAERYADGKADGVDFCELYGWYGDAICDSFCPLPDPDCEEDVGGIPDWTVNDVSILYPMPGPGEVDLLLAMQNETSGGTRALLPEALFARLGQDAPFLTETPDRTTHYPHLRVVSVRFDPCFEQRVLGAGCTRAVRLVAQPIREEEDFVDPSDAAIHLFYELSDAQFVTLLRGYDELSHGGTENVPLGVHPLLREQGLGGELARGLNALLVSVISEENLFRMTFMATGRSGNTWFWGIFNRGDDGAFALDTIPGTDPPRDEDGVSLLSPPPEELPAIPGFPSALLYDPYVDMMTTDELASAAARVYEIEDPTVTDSTNVSCATCHVASRNLDAAFAHRELELPPDVGYAPPPGQNVELTDETHLDRRSLHGFSYFFERPAISRRAVKDSAAAAGFISSAEFTDTLTPEARAIRTAPSM